MIGGGLSWLNLFKNLLNLRTHGRDWSINQLTLLMYSQLTSTNPANHHLNGLGQILIHGFQYNNHFCSFLPTGPETQKDEEEEKERKRKRMGEEGRRKGGGRNRGKTEEGAKREKERKVKFKEKEKRKIIPGTAPTCEAEQEDRKFKT